MRNSLSQIAASIDELLKTDAFPDAVRPAFLARAVRDYPCRGGKRLRPALAVWCCRLLGGRDRDVLFPAAALEVWHNWTLVHDDIIDQDAFRRGEPTSHTALAAAMAEYRREGGDAARLGEDFAILTGDLQQAWANDLLLRAASVGVREDVVLAISNRMQRLGGVELISGEALDIEFSLRPIESIHPSEVIEMFRLKTGALLRLAAEAGAMIALGTPDFNDERVRKLGEFAELAGVAFQLRDDELGIFGDQAKLGKMIGNDLKEAKPTVLLLTTLARLEPASRQELLGFLRRESYSELEISRVRDLMRSSGAADEVAALAHRYANEARAILGAFPAGKIRANLEELVEYLVCRDK